jgi:hypothetical protein
LSYPFELLAAAYLLPNDPVAKRQNTNSNDSKSGDKHVIAQISGVVATSTTNGKIGIIGFLTAGGIDRISVLLQERGLQPAQQQTPARRIG